MCGNQFNLKTNLKKQEVSVHGGTKLSCKTCSNQFGRTDCLRTHEESIHG